LNVAEPKPFASLSSGLLARKGAAKPAMRPQGFGQGMGLEDLGWNDMGHGHQPAPNYPAPRDERPEHVPSSISALTPAPRSPALEEPVSTEPTSPPPVVEQQRAIKASFSPEPEDEAVEEQAPQVELPKVKAEVVKLPSRPRSAPGSKGKAAFTLRLDAERHLKLRLACAVTHRSAQQIVSEALESFLESLPELEAMAGHVPATLGKRR
jgi:hypothetical protein